MPPTTRNHIWGTKLGNDQHQNVLLKYFIRDILCLNQHILFSELVKRRMLNEKMFEGDRFIQNSFESYVNVLLYNTVNQRGFRGMVNRVAKNLIVKQNFFLFCRIMMIGCPCRKSGIDKNYEFLFFWVIFWSLCRKPTLPWDTKPKLGMMRKSRKI